MDIPAEISFTNVDASPEIEERIHEKVARLDKIFDRLVACRVAVAYPHKHHQRGNIPRIRIEMSVPGSDELVVSHEPNHLQEKYADPDITNALNEAFRAAERKLKDYKEQLRDKSRPPKQNSA